MDPCREIQTKFSKSFSILKFENQQYKKLDYFNKLEFIGTMRQKIVTSPPKNTINQLRIPSWATFVFFTASKFCTVEKISGGPLAHQCGPPAHFWMPILVQMTLEDVAKLFIIWLLFLSLIFWPQGVKKWKFYHFWTDFSHFGELPDWKGNKWIKWKKLSRRYLFLMWPLFFHFQSGNASKFQKFRPFWRTSWLKRKKLNKTEKLYIGSEDVAKLL